MNDYSNGIQVPPTSRKDICNLTGKIRQVLGIKDSDAFPIIRFLEWVMPEIFQGFDLEIIPKFSDEREACCFPDGNESNPEGPVILLTEAVYEKACRNDGRARFTVAHEIGHVFLHRGIPPSFSRSGLKGVELKPFENSEWQANTFAADLLMPAGSFPAFSTLKNFTSRMCVSESAARCYGRKLIKKGVIKKIVWIN